jgi:phage terminase large subunit-like protein
VAGRNAAGDLVLLEHSAPGEAWVADRLAKLRENIGVLEVALHPSGQAKTLVPALNAAGIEWHKLTLNDLAGGCSSLLNKVENGGFLHLGQSALDAAVAVARAKTTGQGQTVFVSADSPVPMAPLVAASTALYRFELVESEQPDDPPPDIF